MSRTIRGKVAFFNQYPAAGVAIRIFDKDAAGKIDDDLSVSAGLSDAQGNFEVEYDPGRFRDVATVIRTEPRNPPFDWTLIRREHRQTDWLDILLPYIQFSYQFQGQTRQFCAPINWFSSTYLLPQAYTKIPFSPVQNGYHFVNLFKGVALPFSIPEIPRLIHLTGNYGLCGGMASSAYDHYLFNRSIPAQKKIPKSGSALQRHLYRRQMDSFGSLGEYILKFASWMRLPDDTTDGLCCLTMLEFLQYRSRLDNNLGSVLGIIYQKGARISHLFLNHQVFGYGLDILDENHFSLRIYDPNYPDRDDVVIKLERRIVDHYSNEPVYGLECEQWLGNHKVQTIHGFFLMPYIPVQPPTRLG